MRLPISEVFLEHSEREIWMGGELSPESDIASLYAPRFAFIIKLIIKGKPRAQRGRLKGEVIKSRFVFTEKYLKLSSKL